MGLLRSLDRRPTSEFRGDRRPRGSCHREPRRQPRPRHRQPRPRHRHPRPRRKRRRSQRRRRARPGRRFLLRLLRRHRRQPRIRRKKRCSQRRRSRPRRRFLILHRRRHRQPRPRRKRRRSQRRRARPGRRFLLLLLLLLLIRRRRRRRRRPPRSRSRSRHRGRFRRSSSGLWHLALASLRRRYCQHRGCRSLPLPRLGSPALPRTSAKTARALAAIRKATVASEPASKAALRAKQPHWRSSPTGEAALREAMVERPTVKCRRAPFHLPLGCRLL